MNLEEKIEDLKRLEYLFNLHVVPVLAEQVQERVSAVMRTPLTPERLYSQEMEKGICVGLEMASSLPAVLLEQAKADLELLIKEQSK